MSIWKTNYAPAARRSSGYISMAMGDLGRLLVGEANTKRAGIQKLVLAFLVSPLLTAASWVALLSILLPCMKDYEPCDSFYEFFLEPFLETSAIAFLGTAIALLLGGGFIMRYRLFNVEHFVLYAIAATFVLTFVLMSIITEWRSEASFVMTIGMMAVMFVPLLLASVGAAFIAFFFWLFGVRNNNWLKNI